MLNNFIYAKQKSLFKEALDNDEVLDEAVVFIEDTKEIWNHGTYFDCSDKHITEENLNEVLSEYITETELNEKGYLTEHLDLSKLALKSEIPNLDGYATELWVTDLSFLTEHQDISLLANKSELPTKTSELTNDSEYITEGRVEEMIANSITNTLNTEV